jgi:hypothetical protein
LSVIVSSSAIPKGERRILISSLSPLAIEVIKVPKKLSPDRHSKKN